MKKFSFDLVLWGLFAGIGATLLIAGLCFYLPLLPNRSQGNATATITHMDNSRTYVTYTVDGTDYCSDFGGTSSSYQVGKEVPIYYELEDPSRIGNRAMDALFLILPGIGLFFLLLGGGGLAFLSRKRGMAKWLRQNGRQVHGEYVETRINLSYTVGNRHPYKVICRWQNPLDGKIYLYKSENLWTNPAPLIHSRNIQYFPIYLDPNKPKKYTMDVSALLQDMAVVDLT